MDDDLRILVLGDEESPGDLIDYELSKSNLRISALRVTTLELFLNSLQDYLPTLILITAEYPEISALTALALAQEICPRTPCFLISPTTSRRRNLGEQAKLPQKTDPQVRRSGLEPTITGFFEAIGTASLLCAEPNASIRARDALQPLMQVTGLIIVFRSPEGNILEFNLGAEHFTGWDRLEILGKDGIELCFPEDHRTSARAHLKRVWSGTSVDSIDLPLQVRDGSTPAYRWYFNLISDGQDKTAGIMLVGQPLTESRSCQILPRARLARCSPSPAPHQGRGLLTRRTGTC
jgi:PAS domain S-box-containing protein